MWTWTRFLFFCRLSWKLVMVLWQWYSHKYTFIKYIYVVLIVQKKRNRGWSSWVCHFAIRARYRFADINIATPTMVGTRMGECACQMQKIVQCIVYSSSFLPLSLQSFAMVRYRFRNRSNNECCLRCQVQSSYNCKRKHWKRGAWKWHKLYAALR